MKTTRVGAVVCAAATALAGCTSSGPASTGSTAPSGAVSRASSATPTRPSITKPSSRRPTAPPAPSPRRSAAERALAAMSLRERVGQLIMVDCPTTGVSDATTTAITQDHVGSVILDGTSRLGLQATANITAQLRSLAPSKVGLFISTDQEGGIVQRLQGPGFTRIPSGVAQGTIDPAALQRQAKQWGTELRQAGVNVNLAPVLDTVPSGGGPNPPIGELERQYGDTPATVTSHGLAYARGMTAAGIDVTVKHFPGLGRVAGNTDVTAGVTDSVTTRDDAYLAPFRAAIRARVPFVMMSTAIYARLDPGTPAAFSKPIITGLLRHKLGFGGLIISDDIGAAAQVSARSPGQRAVAFVAAGGDVVLTVDAGVTGEMTSALVAKAQADPAFRKRVDAAALLVLQAKNAQGLLA